MINEVNKTETKTTKIIESVTCDRCKTVYSYEGDPFEYQEIFFIHFEGGYGSVFGDGNLVVCEICQKCIKELIGDFCRVL